MLATVLIILILVGYIVILFNSREKTIIIGAALLLYIIVPILYFMTSYDMTSYGMTELNDSTYFIAYETYNMSTLSHKGYILYNIPWHDLEDFDSYIENIIRNKLSIKTDSIILTKVL